MPSLHRIILGTSKKEEDNSLTIQSPHNKFINVPYYYKYRKTYFRKARRVASFFDFNVPTSIKVYYVPMTNHLNFEVI